MSKQEIILDIGSDPEFMLRDITTNRIIPARHYLYDDENIKSIGLDGNSNTGELRPGYGTPGDHFDNITCLINRLGKEIDLSKVKVVCGNGNSKHPLGGHLHFSGRNITKSRHLQQSDILKLDMLAVLLAQIENKRNFISRRKKYGKLSACRAQEHGYEYRTLSSWIVNKELCYNVLHLAYAIVHASLCDQLDNVLDYELVTWNFKKCKTEKLSKYNKKIIAAFKKMPLVRSNSKYGLALKWLIDQLNNNKKIREGSNIVRNWGCAWTKILSFSNDYYLKDIKELIEPVSTKILNGTPQKYWHKTKKVHIFGLSSEREYDFLINNNKLEPIIRKTFSHAKIEVREDQNNKFKLGIHFNLRDKYRKEIVYLITDLLKEFCESKKIDGGDN